MRVGWARRVIFTGAAFVTVWGVMTIIDMHPSPVLLALVVLVLAGVMWLVLDVSIGVSATSWHPPERPPQSITMTDARISIIRMRLYDSRDADRPAGRVYESMVDIIDDRLLAEHGIDRRRDPLAASTVLGPVLTDFVTHVPSQRTFAQPQRLAGILTLIEDL